MKRKCLPPIVLGYCDGPDDEPHWCAPLADDAREDADALAREARDDWADPWWGRLVFAYSHHDDTLEVRTMHPIPDTNEYPGSTTMTSNNTDPKAPRKPGPWESLLMLIIALAALFGFIAGISMLLK